MLQAENPAYLKYKTATNWKRPGEATACCNRIKGYISGNALESALSYLDFFVEATISLYQTLLLGYLTNAIFGWLYKWHT